MSVLSCPLLCPTLSSEVSQKQPMLYEPVIVSGTSCAINHMKTRPNQAANHCCECFQVMRGCVKKKVFGIHITKEQKDSVHLRSSKSHTYSMQGRRWAVAHRRMVHITPHTSYCYINIVKTSPILRSTHIYNIYIYIYMCVCVKVQLEEM